MATNITGVIITKPTEDPAIQVDDSFEMGGQIATSGGGGWGESGDMYFQWDQGTATWVDIGEGGGLYTEDTNPITGLQTTTEQTITVYGGSAGTFNVRIKLIEDDLTEHLSSSVEVTVNSAPIIPVVRKVCGV